MGVFDRFEKAVEQGVNAPFSKMFKSRVKAVDIASAIRESMEDHAASLSNGRTVVPNEYEVCLAQADLDAVQNSNSQILGQELEYEVTRHAKEQNFSFVGPIVIRFSVDAAQTTGTINVHTLTKRGPAAPVTTAQASPQHPIISIEGREWLLTEPVTVIGRGSEADIVIHDSGVSRRHLELRITPTGVIATDLGSTNGTYIEGHRIDAATLLDGNELTIGRTHILFWTSSEDK
ncbi:DUF3662 domain-containing protein [Nanchangia anserum]|uniref:DUF3662 domain-containing protein n=1 Tax=Nanchangia anserum TaxID=2692125 RepID=A0A8I0KWA0_9ACTO|nr:DUF3662 and FHA domain-containing protein [Nanchangia anserum]MBD3689799.1 DUF3662 domain-containing protein [Nanchangia anserum]QOX81972.1 DUF3662 domain-containing protein [Nanchangia anserum]